MSVDPPRRTLLPSVYIPLGRAPVVWRPATLWAAIVHYGIAHGMVPASVAARIMPEAPVSISPAEAPVSISPSTPLSTTRTIVISMKPATPPPTPTPSPAPTPKPAPAPVEAAPPTAAAPVHVAPRVGMGVHPV